MSTTTLQQEARGLRNALRTSDGEVSVLLSRETAEFVARVVEAKATGREVIVANARQEVTPAEAALMMGMSRPQVRKLMDLGMLPYRMVGTHHRIPVAGMREYLDQEKVRRRAALQHLANVQNDMGLME